MDYASLIKIFLVKIAFIDGEGLQKNLRTAWLWLIVLLAWGIVVSGGQYLYSNWMEKQRQAHPFLQVTNRQMSLFLWQFPEYMRANVKQKNGYLPAFRYIDKIGLDPAQADDYVEAPPQLLFLYHTWQRLLAGYYFPEPISAEEFIQFIRDAEEWQPQYWKAAPKSYIDFIDNFSKLQIENLSGLSLDVLPLVVRQAFQGWKNFHKEGIAINQQEITYIEMEKFLESYPNYRRNYWKNIFQQNRPNYLLHVGGKNSTEQIPSDQLSGFLRAAYKKRSYH